MAEKKYSHKQMKKMMKEDEVASFVDKALKWGKENKGLVYGIAIAVIVAVAGYVAITSYTSNKVEKSELAFSKASKIFYYQPKRNETPKYKSKKEQYTKAMEEFKKLETGNYTDSVKLRAQYYEGLCNLNLNNTAEAEKILEKLYGNSPYPLKTTVGLTLANIKANTGEIDNAIKILDALMQQNTYNNPVKDAGKSRKIKRSKRVVKSVNS